MNKQEIFDRIAEACATACKVRKEDILNGCRKEDVVTARTILVFWADAAGYSVESLVDCAEINSANSINSIKARIEDFWINKFAFHVLVIEVGKELLDYAHTIGEDFDMWKPIKRMSRRTGKY